MKNTNLLPERHLNQDFFIADIFDAIPIKNNRAMMEHPFFTLSTKKDIRSVEYECEGVKISLHPSAKYGLPTMMDKDVLLYCGSLIMAEINKGNIPPKSIRFSAHDLMITTNRETNGKAYKLLRNAFERLTGCMITTDIKTNEVEQTKGFHILESYQILKSSHDSKRMVRVEVTLSDWFYNALISKEVLTINREYFRLRKTLERRLYELVRKHCGKQEQWSIGLNKLMSKCGALSELKKFRFQIRQIIITNHLPDYLLSLRDDIVTFNHRNPKYIQLSLSLDDIPDINAETIRKGAELVKKANTEWDYNEIRSQFTEQLIGGFSPKNVNGAFINFVKKKINNLT